MSTLILDEMYPDVIFRQSFYINEDIEVAHIRPWIYKQGTLTEGVFECRIYNGATLIASSTIDYTEINAIDVLNFSHGFIRFDFNATTLQRPEGSASKEYQIEFELTGQTAKDSANFIGICRAWDNDLYPPVIDPPNAFVHPAGFEIYTFKEKL